jgi:hypothetical protein
MPEEKTLFERPPSESKAWRRSAVMEAMFADVGFSIVGTTKNTRSGNAKAQSSKALQGTALAPQQQLSA